MTTLTIINGGASHTAAQTIGVVVGHSTQMVQTVSMPEPALVSSITAQLPALPEPLKLLYGPLLVTIDTWSDGSVVARIPSVSLYAVGASDTLALLELGDEVFEFAQEMTAKIAAGEKVAGPLKHQWRALTSMIDVSALPR